MTRTYALHRLLALGGLTHREIAEITGWPRRAVDSAIQRLTNMDVLERKGNPRHYVYALSGDLEGLT